MELYKLLGGFIRCSFPHPLLYSTTLEAFEGTQCLSSEGQRSEASLIHSDGFGFSFQRGFAGVGAGHCFLLPLHFLALLFGLGWS